MSYEIDNRIYNIRIECIDVFSLSGGCVSDLKQQLEAEIESLQLDTIHSCSNQCRRTPCVQRREIESLKAKNQILTEALEEYSRGCAIRIKSEKWHLYDQDYATYSPQWYQRSMSDYDDRIVAREALAKVKEVK